MDREISFSIQWLNFLLLSSLLTKALTRNSNPIHALQRQRYRLMTNLWYNNTLSQCVSKTPISIVVISRLYEFSSSTLGMLTLSIIYHIIVSWTIHRAALTLFLATTDAVRITRCSPPPPTHVLPK